MTTRIPVSSDITNLYTYRVRQPDGEYLSKVNRYQAAQQVARWMLRGINKWEIEAEKLTNGRWVKDEQTYDLATKHVAAMLEKKNGNGRAAAQPNGKVLTIQHVMRELRSACTLALQADSLTDMHIDVLKERMSTLWRLLEASTVEASNEQDFDEEPDEEGHGQG